jgi:hypothetical protein
MPSSTATAHSVESEMFCQDLYHCLISIFGNDSLCRRNYGDKPTCSENSYFKFSSLHE